MSAKLINSLVATRVPHPNYLDAVRETHAHATLMPPGSVITLTGPTRVGKSRAVKEVMASAFPDHPPDGLCPVVYVDASTTDRGFMSTRYLVLCLLRKLEHPFYSDDGYQPKLSQTETVARLHLSSALLHRQTKLVVVDEAHHLLRMPRRAARGAALDSLKCLGNETGVTILLAGGYELLGTIFESSHLNGRLTIVEFPRYQPTPAGIATFDRILLTYDAMLPWVKGTSLVGMRDFIYEGTLGCHGLIVHWIEQAVCRMTAHHRRHLLKEDFQRVRFGLQLAPIRDEIAFGEGLIGSLQESRRRPSRQNVGKAGKPKGRSARKPGLRSPRRDPVGI